MQSGDDGLAQLAEKLHGIRENLPGADGETPNVPASDIRIKRNSGNVNFGTQVNIGAPIISEPIALSAEELEQQGGGNRRDLRRRSSRHLARSPSYEIRHR